MVNLSLVDTKPVMEFVSSIFDKIWPDPKIASDAKIKLYELEQSGQLASMANESALLKMQADINLKDAESEDKYQRRWRPSFGWVCVIGYSYHYIVRPFTVDIFAMFGHVLTLTEININALETLTFGILGLSTIRGVEKITSMYKGNK